MKAQQPPLLDVTCALRGGGGCVVRRRDGHLEVVVGTSMGFLYVLSGKTGSPLPGWPIQVCARALHRVARSCPGQEHARCAASPEPSRLARTLRGKNPNHTQMGEVQGQALVLDVNGDGLNEVVAGARMHPSPTFAPFRRQPHRHPPLYGSSPGSPRVSILAVQRQALTLTLTHRAWRVWWAAGDTRGNVAAFKASGEEVWSRHVRSLVAQGPTAADVNGDGEIEVRGASCAAPRGHCRGPEPGRLRAAFKASCVRTRGARLCVYGRAVAERPTACLRWQSGGRAVDLWCHAVPCARAPRAPAGGVWHGQRPRVRAGGEHRRRHQGLPLPHARQVRRRWTVWVLARGCRHALALGQNCAWP